MLDNYTSIHLLKAMVKVTIPLLIAIIMALIIVKLQNRKDD